MRKEHRRSGGYGRNVALAALAVGAIAAFGFWPKAEATPSQAAALEAQCGPREPETRQLMAIDRLVRLDSNAAREALARLADSGDDRVAARAIGGLCRSGGSSARSKLESVFEDTGRSDAARMCAMAAWCKLKSGDSASWSSIKQYIKTTAGENDALCEQWAAAKALFWAQESDDE